MSKINIRETQFVSLLFNFHDSYESWIDCMEVEKKDQRTWNIVNDIKDMMAVVRTKRILSLLSSNFKEEC